MLNGTNWGSWKFDSSSQEAINDLKSFPCDQPSEALKRLIHCAKDDNVPPEPPTSSWEEISEVFNDLAFEPKKPEGLKNKASQDKLTESSHINEEPSILAKKIVQILREDSAKKQAIVNILAHQKEERLTIVLKTAWSQINTVDEKKSFIASVSDNLEARNWICLNIIRSWMLDNFVEALESLKDLMHCLGTSVLETILSLADGEEAFFVRESNYFKEIHSFLEPNQMNELARKLIHSIRPKLETWHLTLLMAVTETSLSEANLEELLNLIEKDMALYIRDRYMGKILTNIVNSQLGSNSPTYLIDKTVSITNSYRGITKTMLLRNLENLRTQ